MATDRAPRWRRPLFLGTSALVSLSVVIAARDVMLPFVLAILIAYVLTPLVAKPATKIQTRNRRKVT